MCSGLIDKLKSSSIVFYLWEIEDPFSEHKPLIEGDVIGDELEDDDCPF